MSDRQEGGRDSSHYRNRKRKVELEREEGEQDYRCICNSQSKNASMNFFCKVVGPPPSHSCLQACFLMTLCWVCHGPSSGIPLRNQNPRTVCFLCVGVCVVWDLEYSLCIFPLTSYLQTKYNNQFTCNFDWQHILKCFAINSGKLHLWPFSNISVFLNQSYSPQEKLNVRMKGCMFTKKK